MNLRHSPEMILPDVRVPMSVLAAPGTFGGVRDQDCLRGDLVVREGRAVGLKPVSEAENASRMLLPRLTECHVHLDKCHTIHRMEGVGGDLRAAIDAQARDREGWTEADIRARATRGLMELIQAGCGTVRTHVDWSRKDDPTAAPPAWPVLRELADEMRDRVQLQIAPLIGIEVLADPVVADTLGREIARDGGVLGAFVFGQPLACDGIRQAFRVAEKHGLPLDFHVDEGLDPALNGLLMIADTAIETGFGGPILCGHACSLANLDGDPLKTMLDKLSRSGVTVASLPTTNLYLQGRTDGTPDRRGITRIRELREAGVPVVVGTDNVRDAFCPLGAHDPRQSLALAALAAHLDPPFGQYLPMITIEARRALGLAPQTVDGAALDDLLIFDAATTAELLAGGTPPRPLTSILLRETT